MTLGLNLSASEGKLAHARKHQDSLESEVPAELAQDGPYAIRFSSVDPNTGWCDVFLVPNKPHKPRLSAIVGDVIHNLRCALDYIVTTLADASGTAVTTRHQFPIFRTEEGYEARVVNNPSGALQGINHGLTLMRDLQPYKLQPDPRRDPLWHVHRFNNADKHREPVALLAIPSGAIQLHFNGIPLETEPVLEISNWSPDQEYVIHRIRFDPPWAYNLRAEGPIQLQVSFTTPPFEAEPAHSVTIGQLRAACDHMAMVIEAFKML